MEKILKKIGVILLLTAFFGTPALCSQVIVEKKIVKFRAGWDEFKLKERVKSFEVDLGNDNIHSVTFDLKGRILIDSTTGGDGTLEWISNQYEDNGLLMKKTLKRKRLVRAPRKPKPIMQEGEFVEDSFFDKNGLLKKKEYHTKKGKLYHIKIYHYDEKGQLEKLVDKRGDDSVSEETKYVYDKNDRVTEINSKTDRGNTITKFSYSGKFGSYTKVESLFIKDKKKNERKHVVRLDKEGNELGREEQFQMEGKLKKHTKESYQYNLVGLIKEQTNSNELKSTSEVVIYSYKYDKKNNWIEKMTTFFDSKGFQIEKKTAVETRKIDYFKPTK